jgi:hypothetical protein
MSPPLLCALGLPGNDGQFIFRPHFLASRELARNNILHHAGAPWEIVNFQSSARALLFLQFGSLSILSSGRSGIAETQLLPWLILSI